VITAVPAPTAVSTPAPLKVATAGLELLHATTTALGSKSPMTKRVAADPADRARFTGATRTLAPEPLTATRSLAPPPAFAEVDTDPRPTPVTTSLPDTNATPALERPHPDTLAGSGVPGARTVADNRTPPISRLNGTPPDRHTQCRIETVNGTAILGRGRRSLTLPRHPVPQPHRGPVTNRHAVCLGRT